MVDKRVTLSALWVSLVLIYLLGDVLRGFAGDFEPGKLGGQDAAQWMWIVAAIVILIPISMVVLSLALPYAIARWAVIAVATALFLFNVFSLGGYPGLYDRFLLVVSFVVNAITVVVAWRWQDLA